MGRRGGRRGGGAGRDRGRGSRGGRSRDRSVRRRGRGSLRGEGGRDVGLRGGAVGRSLVVSLVGWLLRESDLLGLLRPGVGERCRRGVGSGWRGRG